MLRSFMRAKIHRATVTHANVEYIGSITLDPRLMKAAGLLPMEQVDVLNCSNGNRLTTYCIEGRSGSGEVGMNGAAALLCSPGDVVLVVAYAHLEAPEIKGFEALTVLVDARNRVKKTHRAKAAFTGKAAPKK
ncbi:MAG TPA: aspartate 1-decarboxylase [bacterium]|jgi:aspartate 1-decarboxylase|nr:aspartate 1-decarboxylase [bacterium]